MPISPETIYCWIYAAAQPGDTGSRHLRRATDAAGDKAGMAGADVCFPGVLTYLSGRSLLQAEPPWGRGDLVCASRDKAAPLSCKERKSRFLLLGRAQQPVEKVFRQGIMMHGRSNCVEEAV